MKADTQLQNNVMAENIQEWSTNRPKDYVKVIVENGWISLSSELDYEYQRQLATASVRHLMGVTDVSSQTTVKPTASSLSIKSDIQAALKRRALIDAEEIIVTAYGGNVAFLALCKVGQNAIW